MTSTIEHKLGEIAFKYIDRMNDWHPEFDKPEELWKTVAEFLAEADPMLEREDMLRRFEDYKPEVEAKAIELYQEYVFRLTGKPVDDPYMLAWSYMDKDYKDDLRYQAMQALYKGK